MTVIFFVTTVVFSYSFFTDVIAALVTTLVTAMFIGIFTTLFIGIVIKALKTVNLINSVY